MRDGVHIRLTLSRGVKVTSGMDPRLNQSGPDADRARGIQISGLRHGRLGAGDQFDTTFSAAQLNQNIHSCNLLQSILAKIEATAMGADDA